MIQTLRAQRALATILLAAVFAACGGDSDGSSSGATSASARCPGACQVPQQACGWSTADTQECVQGCSEEYRSYPAACQPQVDAVFACASTASAWDCDKGKPNGCDAQERAVEDCVKTASSSTGADLGAYCAKCQSCFSQDPSFSEGFCDPFRSGSAFDLAGCTARGDRSEIDDSTLTKPVLDSISCSEFDSRI